MDLDELNRLQDISSTTKNMYKYHLKKVFTLINTHRTDAQILVDQHLRVIQQLQNIDCKDKQRKISYLSAVIKYVSILPNNNEDVLEIYKKH